jgi:hypothetical protein
MPISGRPWPPRNSPPSTGFAFSGETLRKWMIADGLWLDRKQRQRRVHQPRPRRECVGELVQVDGSVHWWFEDRGPKCTPLVFVDDATSRLMHLQFVESESTFLCARQGSARCAAQDPSGPPISLRWCGHSRILRHRGCMISIS